MNIIELAKEYGDSTWIDDNPLSFTFAIKNLQAFATAIIEDYKAGLVPVAWMATDENHIEWRKGSLIELGFKEDEIKPLYALGETK
jgi:hypothetical protein